MFIMTIDDSPTMRKIVGLSLKTESFEIIEAENGLDALAKLLEQKVDLFIVDINMPVMDGIEFVKVLRNNVDYARTPVIMLTTESEKELVVKGKEAGANAWVIKPFKNEDLTGLVHKLI